jgi:hypothetical protein
MVWQKLYAKMDDDKSETIKTSSSRRGIVNNIGYEVLSSCGQPIEVISRYHEAKRVKIDLRRINKDSREKVKKAIDKKWAEETFFEHRVEFNFFLTGENHRFYINNILISDDLLERLQKEASAGPAASLND